MTSARLNFEYIKLEEPIIPIGKIRVDRWWYTPSNVVFLKRNWIKFQADHHYSKREPMLTDAQVDKLVNIEWIYYEDV